MMRRRWSDNDLNLGPITLAWDDWSAWGVLLCSGGEDDEAACLRLRLGRATAILWLPGKLLPPHRVKHWAKGWDAATIARLGRDWYYEEHRREYGFQFTGTGAIVNSTMLTISYGAQTHDSSTEKSKSWFLPWTEWRHVRHSLYGLDGKLFAHMPARIYTLDGLRSHDSFVHLEATCPTACFVFRDFDGEKLTVTTRIEEREWRLGDGWWRWLSRFAKPHVQRSLDLRFSGEVGERKGSWKGGTLGHSIQMLPGELHEGAFRRYCAAHGMTYVGPEARG